MSSEKGSDAADGGVEEAGRGSETGQSLADLGVSQNPEDLGIEEPQAGSSLADLGISQNLEDLGIEEPQTGSSLADLGISQNLEDLGIEDPQAGKSLADLGTSQSVADEGAEAPKTSRSLEDQDDAPGPGSAPAADAGQGPEANRSSADLGTSNGLKDPGVADVTPGEAPAVPSTPRGGRADVDASGSPSAVHLAESQRRGAEAESSPNIESTMAASVAESQTPRADIDQSHRLSEVYVPSRSSSIAQGPLIDLPLDKAIAAVKARPTFAALWDDFNSEPGSPASKSSPRTSRSSPMGKVSPRQLGSMCPVGSPTFLEATWPAMSPRQEHLKSGEGRGGNPLGAGGATVGWVSGRKCDTPTRLVHAYRTPGLGGGSPDVSPWSASATPRTPRPAAKSHDEMEEAVETWSKGYSLHIFDHAAKHQEQKERRKAKWPEAITEPQLSPSTKKMMKSRKPAEVYDNLYQDGKEQALRSIDRQRDGMTEVEGKLKPAPEISSRAKRIKGLQDRGDIWGRLHQLHKDLEEKRSEQAAEREREEDALHTGPSISAYSQQLAAGREPLLDRLADLREKKQERISAELEQREEDFKKVFTFRPKIRSSDDDRAQQQEPDVIKQERERKYQMIREADEKQEMAQCPFAPELNPKSRKLAASVHEKGVPAHTRMYSDHQEEQARAALDKVCNWLTHKGVKLADLLYGPLYNTLQRRSFRSEDLLELAAKADLDMSMKDCRSLLLCLSKPRSAEADIRTLEVGIKAYQRGRPVSELQAAVKEADLSSSCPPSLLFTGSRRRAGGGQRQEAPRDSSPREYQTACLAPDCFIGSAYTPPPSLFEEVFSGGRSEEEVQRPPGIRSVWDIIQENGKPVAHATSRYANGGSLATDGKVVCPHHGCGQLFPDGLLYLHMQSCEFRLVKCSEPKCKLALQARELPAHRIMHICARGHVAYDAASRRATPVTEIVFKPCRFGDKDAAEAEVLTDENTVAVLRDLLDLYKVIGGGVAVVMQRNAHKNIFNAKYKAWWKTLCADRGKCVVDMLVQQGIPEANMEVRVLDADSEVVYVEFVGDDGIEDRASTVWSGRAERMPSAESRRAVQSVAVARPTTVVNRRSASESATKSSPPRTVRIQRDSGDVEGGKRLSVHSESLSMTSKTSCATARLSHIYNKFDHLLQGSSTPSTSPPSPTSPSLSLATS